MALSCRLYGSAKSKTDALGPSNHLWLVDVLFSVQGLFLLVHQTTFDSSKFQFTGISFPLQYIGPDMARQRHLLWGHQDSSSSSIKQSPARQIPSFIGPPKLSFICLIHLFGVYQDPSLGSIKIIKDSSRHLLEHHFPSTILQRTPAYKAADHVHHQAANHAHCLLHQQATNHAHYLLHYQATNHAHYLRFFIICPLHAVLINLSSRVRV